MVAISYTYAIPYVLVFFILVYLLWKEKKGYANAGKIALFLMLFFIGLRGHVYTDYISYYPYYRELPSIFDISYYLQETNYEKGFVIYSSIIKTIFPNYFIWVFINSLIDLSIFYWLFKRYSLSVVLSCIVFLAFNGLAIEFNLYRNSKAIVLFLLSIPLLQERRFIPYLLINVIACTFHISAVLYIPLYFILTKKYSKFLIWLIFICVNAIFILKISISGKLLGMLSPLIGGEGIVNKLGDYFISAEAYGFSFGYFERTVSFILFTVYYDRLVRASRCNMIFYNCFFVYYVLFYVFADVTVFAERIPLIFIFSYWVLYPNILGVLKQNNRRIILFFILLLCFMKIIIANNNITSKYDNILFGAMSFDTREVIFHNNMDKVL